MYLCMHVCMYVCMYACMYVFTSFENMFTLALQNTAENTEYLRLRLW